MSPDADVSPWSHLAFPIYAWTGLRDRDFLFYVKSMRQFIDACALPFPERLNQAEEAGTRSETEIQSRKLLIFSRMLLPALRRSMDKAAEIEARLRCAEAALAVELYRTRNQAVPKSLSFLDQEPAAGALRDPFDGEPLRYRQLQPGYLIYSLGPDGTDEGGAQRAKSGGSGVRQLRPQTTSEEAPQPKAARGNAGRGYDITFAVNR
jgi:type II secretory pathway pseudopilin PulG